MVKLVIFGAMVFLVPIALVALVALALVYFIIGALCAPLRVF